MSKDARNNEDDQLPNIRSHTSMFNENLQNLHSIKAWLRVHCIRIGNANWTSKAGCSRKWSPKNSNRGIYNHTCGVPLCISRRDETWRAKRTPLTEILSEDSGPAPPPSGSRHVHLPTKPSEINHRQLKNFLQSHSINNKKITTTKIHNPTRVLIHWPTMQYSKLCSA